MDILNRFLSYITVPTNSNSNTGTTPSTSTQWNLAKKLVEELKEFGLDEVYLDEEHCYVYALLKGKENVPKIGFISHMDTSEAVTDENMNPQIIKNYDGNDIKLGNLGKLSVDIYPDLKNHVGKTLITTDGNTLLGADDKSGITEIMEMLKYIIDNNIKHGDIYIAFTPDEEIGEGTKYFDLSKFKADFAYTVDGSDLGEISYENFNAATINITIKGISAHLGSAKNVLVNSQLIANEFINMLPKENPENTEKYEGYYHVDSITGNVTLTKIKMLIRDFEKESFENRKNTICNIVEHLNKKYNNCIEINVKDTYYNMKNVILKNIHLVDNAKKAMENLNIKPITQEIRGGTDGALLSEKGLPCPNLGTGGHNYHGIFEYITVEDMEKTVQILVEIVKLYFENKWV